MKVCSIGLEVWGFRVGSLAFFLRGFRFVHLGKGRGDIREGRESCLRFFKKKEKKKKSQNDIVLDDRFKK